MTAYWGLLEKHTPRLKRQCFIVARQYNLEKGDLFSNSLLKAYNGFNSTITEKFLPWFCTVIKTVAYDMAYKDTFRNRTVSIEGYKHLEDDNQDLSHVDDQVTAEQLLCTLPVAEREAIEIGLECPHPRSGNMSAGALVAGVHRTTLTKRRSSGLRKLRDLVPA